MDRQTIGVGVGGAAVVGVAFGMARYAYGLTLPDVRSEFGLSEPLLGLIAGGGAVTSIAAPAATGSLIPLLGRSTTLVCVAVVTAFGAAGLAVASRPPRGVERDHRS